jgi:hypothetical protein
MLRFPIVPAECDPPAPRMRLVDYARFSEACLKSNTAITAGNCLEKRADEKFIERPFSLVWPAVAGDGPGRRKTGWKGATSFDGFV